MQSQRLIQFSLNVCILFFLASCSKKEDDCPPDTAAPGTGELVVSFTATSSGSAYVPGKIYNDALNRKVFAEQFYHYVSNIRLLNEDTGISVASAQLIRYGDSATSDPDEMFQAFSVNLPAGAYSGISLGIGLDPLLNASNPSSFDPTHPLSAYQGTYWSTWEKYKFIVIDGRADFAASGTPDSIYSFHTGFDTCYRERAFLKAISIEKGKSAKLAFTIEMNDIFFGTDTVDVAQEATWHGEMVNISRAIRLSDNFIGAVKLE